MALKVFHVQGIRHQAVVFARSAEEAVAEALERELVGDWEAPEAEEIPLPSGYRLVYDRRAVAEQAQLPASQMPPEPEKPHTITASGVKVYEDWHDNFIVDADAPVLAWKAQRDIFGTNTSVPGCPYLASENSEDALSWNLFRTLERTDHLDIISRALDLDDEFEVLYWYHPWDASGPSPEVRAALNRLEPWGKVGGRYQTETDIILKGRDCLVMVESKLGKPATRVRAWERQSKTPIPPTYEAPLRPLLVNMDDWEATMRRFYQLLRHLILANELCKSDDWPGEPHLLAIVNAFNSNRNGVAHTAEFEHLRSCLRVAPERLHLLTWQQLLARIEAKLDPGLRPLLAHANRLSYLQEAKL